MWTIVVISGAVGLIIYRYKAKFTAAYSDARRATAPIRSSLIPVPDLYRQILQKYFPYYQQLTGHEKALFERKVCNFLYGKRFVPRNVDEVTIEAKILIAATAVQLTFGLPDIYLRHFNTILVYPDDYYSTITRRFHRGEVNPMFGIIVLSWQSFIDGFIHGDSGVNLGLHEMAHALRLENIIYNEEYAFFDADLLDRLDALGQRVCYSNYSLDEMILRPYACASKHEFFSVAVENFFERPTILRESMPELYAILCKLLNQDPALIEA
jgi:hypothetical protein